MAGMTTSPFATSHDTIGRSNLGSPTFMPSSPPPHLLQRPRQSPPPPTNDSHKNRGSLQQEESEGKRTVALSSSSMPKPNAVAVTSPKTNALDARLAEYTLDLSKFPGVGGGGMDGDDNEDEPDHDHDFSHPAKDNDRDSEPAGPEDFTMNLTDYILGGRGKVSERVNEDEKYHNAEKEEHNRSPSKQDAEAGDESEFGPPVDVSTPSHLMWRKNNFPSGREGGTQLEDVEEDLIESPAHRASSPSKRPDEDEEDSSQDDTYALVMREIDHLRVELKNRDEQILSNRKRVLEANSLGEEVRYLRGELERKDALLSEKNSEGDEKATLREQIRVLQAENDAKTMLLERREKTPSSQEVVSSEGFSHDSCEKTIASLRQQLHDTEEQLKRREDTLEETMRRLQETTSATELQLRRKETEMENLKAQIDDDHLELDRMETDLQTADENYKLLEERIGSLEVRNRPLEEKNILLEREVTKAKTQLDSQERALSILVSDLAITTDAKPHKELVELLRDWCQSRTGAVNASVTRQSPQEAENHLHQKAISLQAESEKTVSAKQSLGIELQRAQAQVSEFQSLNKTIESENARLSARLEEVNRNLTAARADFARLKDQHAHCTAALPNDAQNRTEISGEQQDLVIQSLRAEIQALQSAHAATLSNLKNSHTQTTTHLRTLLTESEEREHSLLTELRHLRALQLESNSSAATIEELRDEIQRLESLLLVKDEAAADMDQRIAEALANREREWERRIGKLLHERDRMGKALLLAWGEKELGRSDNRKLRKPSSSSGSSRSSHGHDHDLGPEKVLREDRNRGNTSTNGPAAGDEISNKTPSSQAYRYKYLKSRPQQDGHIP